MAERETITQERVLRTAIPGPRSLELQARRDKVVSAGVSSTLPAYIERGRARSSSTQTGTS